MATKMNAKGHKTDSSMDEKNVKYNEKSANEDEGWTTVVSKKRKIVNRKTVNVCNVDEHSSANNLSSDDSFIKLENPKKKKVMKSKTQKHKNLSPTSKCPICLRSFTRVLQHLNTAKSCKSQCTDAQREVLKNESKLRRTGKNREAAKKYYGNKKKNDPDTFRIK